MTSKKSSADTFLFTFLYTIKRSIWLPLILFVYGIAHHVGAVISVATETEETAWLNSNSVSYVFSYDSTDMAALLLTALMVLVPVGVAVLNFRHMMNKSAVNVYFSLGVSRTSMFFSKYIAGCTMLVASVSIPLLLSALANCAFFGPSYEMWINFAFILLNYILYVLIIYSVTVLMLSLVGSIFEALVMSAVFLVSPYIILYFVKFLFSTFLTGSPYTDVRWATTASHISVIGQDLIEGYTPFFSAEPFYFFLLSSPYQNSVVGYKENPVEIPDFTSLIFWASAVIIVSLLAWVAYRKRKTEIAGFMGSNKLLTCVSVFLISTALSCYVLPGIFTIESDMVLILLSALVFAVTYLFINMMSLRNFKKLIKDLWRLPVILGIYLVCIAVFATGFFGYSTRIPEAEKIKSVTIETETGDIVLHSSVTSYYDYYYFDSSVDFLPSNLLVDESYDHTAVGNFTSDKDISRALDIHKKLIEAAKKDVTDESVFASHDERAIPVSISIVYHLDDGSLFKRAYYTADNAILRQLAEFTKSETYVDLAIDYLTQNNKENYEPDIGLIEAPVSLASPNFSSFIYSPEYNGESSLTNAILENLGKDIENGTFSLDFRNDSELLGYIVFKDISSTIGNDNYSSYISENGNQIVESPRGSYEITQEFDVNSAAQCYLMQDHGGITIPVYSNMKNTASFLEYNGLIKYFENKQTAVELRLWEYGNGYSTDMWFIRGSSMLFNGLWHNGELTDYYYGELPSLPEGSVTVTDSAQIAEYEESSRMVYLTCYDGYYAQFIYPDGTMTFAYIPK